MQLTSPSPPTVLVPDEAPIVRGGPLPGGEADREVFGYQLGQLWRRRWQIGGLVLAAVVGTLLLTTKMTKQYESTIVIRIDTAGQHLVDQNAQAVSSGDAEMFVTTEEQMVTSPDVLGQTVDALGLIQSAEFAPPAQQAVEPAELRRRVIANLAKRIQVTRPFSTLLLRVGVRTSNPELSAKVANGLGAALLDHEYRTREQAITDGSRYMSVQLDDLRAKMERSQADLVRYETEQDVLNPNDRSNILQARLQQTNEDLGKAQSERVRLEAEYTVASQGPIEALLATETGSRLIGSEEKLRTAQAGLAGMAQIYGPQHPLYREQLAAVEQAQGALQDQRNRLVQQLGAAYSAARKRELLLRDLVQQQKHDLDSFNLRAVQYSVLQGEADSNSKLYYDLLQRTKEADVSAGLRTADGLRIASAATPNSIPVSPRVLLDAVLALLVSLGLGCALALGLGAADQTLVSPEQAESLLGLQVVAWLPAVAGIGLEELRPADFGATPALLQGKNALAPARSSFREAVLSLGSILMFNRGEASVFMITSALPGEGKSTIISNLAAALASSGQRTLLVDADLRKPKIHRIFGFPNTSGLAEVLRGDRTAESSTRAVPGAANLHVLTAGSGMGFSPELLQQNFGHLLDQLRPDYDLILVDSPPVLGLADAMTICPLTDQVLLAVYAGQTDRRLVSAALRQLRAVRAPMLRLILNHVKRNMGGGYSYYGKYDGYYTEAEATEGEDA